MSKADVVQKLKHERGFRYRYSVTNYVELLSRLARGPAPGWENPFGIVRGAFRRIITLCEHEVLPSPEMDFLQRAGLQQYLHPDWVPNTQQTANAVELIANAETLGDITGEGIQTVASVGTPRWVLESSHYLRLTETDETSMSGIMKDLEKYAEETLSKKNIGSLSPWFTKLAAFFLLFHPSSGRTRFQDLSPEEKDRFLAPFTGGAGRMFHAHFTLIALKTINWQEKIDPNDLYDAMQLLLLHEGRVFVTNDKDFFRHKPNSYVQRVLPWEAFKKS
jgi:hypothetical protein